MPMFTPSHLIQSLPTLKAHLYSLHIIVYLLKVNFTYSMHHILSCILDICNRVFSSTMLWSHDGENRCLIYLSTQWLASAFCILDTQ